jgi:hypothetical protein
LNQVAEFRRSWLVEQQIRIKKLGLIAEHPRSQQGIAFARRRLATTPQSRNHSAVTTVRRFLVLGAAVLCLLAGAAHDSAATQTSTCNATRRAARPAPGLSQLSRTWWYRNYVWMGVAGAFKGEGFVADPRGQKIGWYRQRPGHLHVFAKRLDGPPASFVADVIQSYGTRGFQPSGLTFGAPGCWAVTAIVGREASRFVVSVAPFNP